MTGSKDSRSSNKEAGATKDEVAVEATKAEEDVAGVTKAEEAVGVAIRAEAGHMSLGLNPSLRDGTKAMSWPACRMNNDSRCVTCVMAGTTNGRLVRLRASMEANTNSTITLHPTTIHCRHTRHQHLTQWANHRLRRPHPNLIRLEPSTNTSFRTHTHLLTPEISTIQR
jgi:hypothetical protein